MNYSLKQILESYKTEYLIIKKQLDKICDNIKILDNNLEKCIPIMSNNKELIFYFITAKRKIIDASFLIKEKYKELIYQLNNLTFDDNIKNVIHIQNKEKGYHILIPYIEEFKNDLLKLLTSDFVNLMQLNIADNDNKLSIGFDKIYFEKNDGLTEFNYYFKPDLIKLDANEPLVDILSTSFSSELFTPYQQEIINKYK